MTETLTPTFPTVIDNSMRKEFVKCPRSFFYKYILRRIPAGKNEHLNSGGAYAKGLEVFRKLYYASSFHPERINEEREELALIEAFVACTKTYGAYDPPQGSAKTWLTTVFALCNYVEEWPPEEDHLHPYNPSGDDPSVEFSFAIPLSINHPETGEPILYAGKFDMLAENDQGMLGVEDDKSTGSLSKNWVQRWRMESQITGYIWAAEQYGYDVGGRAYIRGVSFLKTQIDYLEVPCLRPKFLIDNWHKQLLFDISRMIDCWNHDYWDYDFGDACSSYGGCPFIELCSIPNPLDWVENDFVENTWSPLHED